MKHAFLCGHPCRPRTYPRWLVQAIWRNYYAKAWKSPGAARPPTGISHKTDQKIIFNRHIVSPVSPALLHVTPCSKYIFFCSCSKICACFIFPLFSINATNVTGSAENLRPGAPHDIFIPCGEIKYNNSVLSLKYFFVFFIFFLSNISYRFFFIR